MKSSKKFISVYCVICFFEVNKYSVEALFVLFNYFLYDCLKENKLSKSGPTLERKRKKERKKERKDGWIGWMDGWMDEWMDGWMVEWIDGLVTFIVIDSGGTTVGRG